MNTQKLAKEATKKMWVKPIVTQISKSIILAKHTSNKDGAKS